MDRARKSRKPVRARVTKLLGEIDAQLAIPCLPQIINLTGLKKRLELARTELETKNENVHEAMLDENQTDQELETEDEQCESYQEKILQACEKLVLFIEPQNPAPASGGSQGAPQQQGDNRTYKLPKIELPKFNGDLKNWLGWWSQFEKIDKDPKLHSSDKFQYLLQATEDKARQMISVFPPTGDNYAAAVESLKRRYGREGLQLQVYLRELLNLVIANVTNKEKISLENLYLRLESHLRALRTLDLSKAEPSMYFYPLVESSLPEEVLRTWLRNTAKVTSVDQKKDKLEDLMEFIKGEVEGEQQITLAQNAFYDSGSKNARAVSNRSRKSEDVPTAQSLYVREVQSCIFCERSNHRSSDCHKAKNMTVDERNKKIQEKRGCFKCFTVGHMYRECTVTPKCKSCRGPHFALMCPSKEQSKGNMDSTSEQMKKLKVESSVATVSQTAKDGLVLMKTVRVFVLSSKGEQINVRLLFDEGSNRSYIKTATAEKLKCKVLEEFKLQTTLFGGNTTVVRPKKRYEVQVRSPSTKFIGTLQLINEDVICGKCPTIPRGPWMDELKKENITVSDTTWESSDIEILIGSNLWPKLMTGRMFKLKSGLIAVESVFGWTLSGEIPSERTHNSYAASAITMLTHGEKTLPEMWDLEHIGINDPADQLSKQEHNEKVKSEFKENIARAVDGRYIVKLPWIDRNIPLPSNRMVCEKRLMSTTRKLEAEELFVTYDHLFKGWEEEGIIEKMHVKLEGGHFLPHHRVLKPESKTTPVRPVFDASCKVGSHPSLNQCLEQGPNLLELIPSILLRFREKDVGVLSDIRKAFQMVCVGEEDKNFQKFLWWEDGKADIMEYQHSRVVFGLNCSPFILAAVLEHHLDQAQYEDKKPVVQLLKSSMYVDNCVLSVDTKEDYSKFREVSIQILEDAKMDLRQWESNCEDTEEEMTLVLGLQWNKRDDTLSCKIRLKQVEKVMINKRGVLSVVSQIYDPIGFTCPASLQMKLMLQSSWTKKLSWDEEWNDEDRNKFLMWHEEIGELGMIQVPRIAIGSNARAVELHLFTDASQDAYAAVVYSRVEQDGFVKVQLLLAKSRLAPLPKEKKTKKALAEIVQERVTIPRLELLGCVIGARLLLSVKESLNYKNVPVVCWSDSTTALAWIRRDENWGTFVGNRVREININTRRGQWRHVPGHLNPADLPSRGCLPQELRESKWWQGPSWLYGDKETWPNSVAQPDENLVAQEKRKSQVIMANLNVEIKEPHFSSYWKNVKTAAWVRRFISNARAVKEFRETGVNFTREEFLNAERDVLIQIQERYFPDGNKGTQIQMKKKEDGLYHIKTRLMHKDDTDLFKSPIVLPNQDALVHQLITFTHQIYCHAGAQFVLNKLREKYWILQGRRTVNRIIRRCVTCRRYAAKSMECDPAPLPAARIETQSSFQTTGVDLAGPFILKGGKKAWMVIYTCAVYRGVYLDIVDSLSTDEFLKSLHKFTCIVGRPETIFSDNGTNFVGAVSMLKRLNWKKIEEKLQVQRISWRFNPPTAAWWGGWWERLIRTVKDLLRRMIAKAKLTRKELETCLAEISYVMNNRPLTTLTENETDLIPLTPAMFMRDLPIQGLPELEAITSRDLQEAYRKINAIKMALKARFRKEYLGNLVQMRAEKKTPDPKVGDIVLVGCDNKKRFDWPLGRILELFYGKDNKIRVAKVRTSRGILERPLQRLYPLEIPNPSEIEITDEVKQSAIHTKEEEELAFEDPKGTNKNMCEAVKRTRCGREVKIPQRYGQWFK